MTNHSHAGLCVKALDTGRVLMLQRGYEDKSDPARGLFEFPGGGLESGESPEEAAVREFQEETGITLPTGTGGGLFEDNDEYIGFIYIVPNEEDIDLHEDSYDNPDGDYKESLCWWDPEIISSLPETVVRPEVLKNDWSLLKSAAVETPCQTPGAQFHVDINDQGIGVFVDNLPPLHLSEEEAELLDDNLHNVTELVLQRYFASREADLGLHLHREHGHNLKDLQSIEREHGSSVLEEIHQGLHHPNDSGVHEVGGDGHYHMDNQTLEKVYPPYGADDYDGDDWDDDHYSSVREDEPVPMTDEVKSIRDNLKNQIKQKSQESQDLDEQSKINKFWRNTSFKKHANWQDDPEYSTNYFQPLNPEMKAQANHPDVDKKGLLNHMSKRFGYSQLSDDPSTGQGSMHDKLYKVEHPQGNAIHKFPGGYGAPDHDTKKEYLFSRVGQVLGAPVGEVDPHVSTGIPNKNGIDPSSFFAPHFQGQDGFDAGKTYAHSQRDPNQPSFQQVSQMKQDKENYTQNVAPTLPGGKKLGLLDDLMGHHDRHEWNWRVTPDNQVRGIDNTAWDPRYHGTESYSPFSVYHREHGGYDPGFMEHIKPGLQSLQPEFESMGMGEDHARMMDNHDMISRARQRWQERGRE